MPRARKSSSLKLIGLIGFDHGGDEKSIITSTLLEWSS